MKTVIIHGWSDCSDSFEKIKTFLAGNGLGPAESILYADYESREDSLTFEDVADGLNDEFIRRKLIWPDGRKREDVNVIVHSTGGLVVRHWLWRYYLRDGNRLAECPVRRIVMLAPANYGSPLAHRGKSFLGQLVKGRWKVGDFLEVGRNFLTGLELASPYQWELAHRDLLGDQSLYGATGIQVTVIVGAEGYDDAFRKHVNKRGTDGTVVIAGTGLNTIKLVLDCCQPRAPGGSYEPYRWFTQPVPDAFAFGVLPGLNHGSIVDDVRRTNGGQVGPLLVEALTLDHTDAAFSAWRKKLRLLTSSTYSATGHDQYQQFVIHAIDDQDVPVKDFTLEFSLLKGERRAAGPLGLVGDAGKPTAKELEFSREAHELLTTEGHQHTSDPSFRRFLVPVKALERLLKKASTAFGGSAILTMRVYVPDIERNIYYATDLLQHIILVDTGNIDSSAPKLLFPNTTTLVELRIDRANRHVSVSEKPKKKQAKTTLRG